MAKVRDDLSPLFRTSHNKTIPLSSGMVQVLSFIVQRNTTGALKHSHSVVQNYPMLLKSNTISNIFYVLESILMYRTFFVHSLSLPRGCVRHSC